MSCSLTVWARTNESLKWHGSAVVNSEIDVWRRQFRYVLKSESLALTRAFGGSFICKACFAIT